MLTEKSPCFHHVSTTKSALSPSRIRVEALEGHHFRPGRQPLTGATAPWNTCALWSVSKLSLTGFLAVSEGLASDKGMGGVEEVAVICLAQQCLQPRPSGSLSSMF